MCSFPVSDYLVLVRFVVVSDCVLVRLGHVCDLVLYFLRVVVVLKSVYFQKCGVIIWGTDEQCVVHKELVSFGVVPVF